MVEMPVLVSAQRSCASETYDYPRLSCWGIVPRPDLNIEAEPYGHFSVPLRIRKIARAPFKIPHFSTDQRVDTRSQIGYDYQNWLLLKVCNQ